MEYYDEVVEIEDKPGHVKPIMESGVLGNTFHDDIELTKPTVTKNQIKLKVLMVRFQETPKIVLRKAVDKVADRQVQLIVTDSHKKSIVLHRIQTAVTQTNRIVSST